LENALCRVVDRQFGTHLQRAGHILVGRFIEPVRGSAGRGFGVPSGALPSIGEFLLVGTLTQDTPAIVCICTNQGPGKRAEHVGVG
jgi:hypothetical protein